MTTAFGCWIGINAIGHVRTFHWRWSWTWTSDIGSFFGWSRCSRRFGRTRANQRIRWNVASLLIRIENQTGRTIQRSSLTTVTRIEFVGTFLGVETVLLTTAIEIHRWQRHRWRLSQRGIGGIRLFSSAIEYTILVLATIRSLIVKQTTRAFELDGRATDANEITIAAEWFDRTHGIRVIAIGFVLAIDDGFDSCQSFIGWFFCWFQGWTTLATASRNMDPGFADFQIAIEI